MSTKTALLVLVFLLVLFASALYGIKSLNKQSSQSIEIPTSTSSQEPKNAKEETGFSSIETGSSSIETTGKNPPDCINDDNICNRSCLNPQDNDCQKCKDGDGLCIKDCPKKDCDCSQTCGEKIEETGSQGTNGYASEKNSDNKDRMYWGR